MQPYGTANLEHDVPVRRAMVFKLASVTKQFTAAAVLRLVQQRRLSLDDKLARFVPELPQASLFRTVRPGSRTHDNCPMTS